jgi:hypothetical protein
LDVNGNFLAVATSAGLIKIFDLSRREKAQGGGEGGKASSAGPGGPKQMGSSGRFCDPFTGASLGRIRSIAVS